MLHTFHVLICILFYILLPAYTDYIHIIIIIVYLYIYCYKNIIILCKTQNICLRLPIFLRFKYIICTYVRTHLTNRETLFIISKIKFISTFAIRKHTYVCPSIQIYIHMYIHTNIRTNKQNENKSSNVTDIILYITNSWRRLQYWMKTNNNNVLFTTCSVNFY